jgi:hypothetical protein
VIALAAWAAPTLLAWLWVRVPPSPSPRRAGAVLAVAAATVALAVAGAAAWPVTDGGAIQEILDRVPYDAIASRPADRVLLIAGSLLLLQATGNALVRLLLSLAGTPVSAQQRLRGGRFIGPMERTLIFGLGLAGHLTAAAVVATAKSLLRFPEISRETQTDIHSATEYFLLGSMASWILALAMLVLL